MTNETLKHLETLTGEEILAQAYEYRSQPGATIDTLLKMYEIAAAKGNPQAAWSAGKCHETGQGTPVDYDKARQYYEQSDAGGFGHAPGALGNLYFEGNGVEQDQTKAFELYVKGAGMGSMEAAYNAGMSMLYGYGTEIDPDNGLRYLAHAADNGYTLAQQAIVNYLEDIPDDEEDEDEEDCDEDEE